MILIIAPCHEWQGISFLANTPAHIDGSGVRPCQPIVLDAPLSELKNLFESLPESTLKRFVMHLLQDPPNPDKLLVTGLWRKLSREERVEFVKGERYG